MVQVVAEGSSGGEGAGWGTGTLLLVGEDSVEGKPGLNMATFCNIT